jgi:hypothetical protein
MERWMVVWYHVVCFIFLFTQYIYHFRYSEIQGVVVKESVLEIIIIYYLAREKRRGRIRTIPTPDSCSSCTKYSATYTYASHVRTYQL